MAQYQRNAGIFSPKVETFIRDHTDGSNAARAATLNLVYGSMRVLPWRGATAKVKISAAIAIAKPISGVRADIKHEVGDEGKSYEVLHFEADE